MKDRRVRQVKILIRERRQDPDVLLRQLRGLRRKPPIRVTPSKRRGS